MEDSIEKLRYPVGKYFPVTPITQNQIEQWKKTIEEFPTALKHTLDKFSEKDFNTAYRPDGWTGNQVIHHLADSHMNSIIRFKLGLTENNPVIKPYIENLWAEHSDVKNLPASVSVKILEGVHERWFVLLNSFTENDWKRTIHHPEKNKNMTLDYLLGMYDWHCHHHLAHLKLIKS
ncbi:MAG TPA: putative metal-dependent hydrolase [Bacteroidia bacterium]|nr:putative metal-dependent hydrolase [Bacteroidia bacterium]HNU33783.1 putative metal-dependent hydrolase [Bacteroidia bacterium]